MKRAQYMSSEQKARWAAAEEREGRKIPRTHENCQRILSAVVKVPVKNEQGDVVRWATKQIPGPARPGKTAKDRANKGR
jgi:hypothetical protein